MRRETGRTYGANELDFDTVMRHLLAIAYTYCDLWVYQTRFWNKTRSETNLSANRITVIIDRTLDDFVLLSLHIDLLPQFFPIELDVDVDR